MSAAPALNKAAEHPLLTPDDVAEFLQIPTATIYEYARRWNDPLPSFKIGKHVRFDHASLGAWLGRRRRDDSVRGNELQTAES